MIKIENTEVVGFEPAVRGMRNPKNSWHKSDSYFEDLIDVNSKAYSIGDADHKLMMKLSSGGPVHAKYRRMIVVYVDVTAPLYWWKEFDTYKVGTVSNSCSTMHKIQSKQFTLEDFSTEHLSGIYLRTLKDTIDALETARLKFIETEDKYYWWQMIQLLPSSYNQKRTIMLSYEVLSNIYKWRRHHKMDKGHWDVFCDWIESLPYSEIITGDIKDEQE